VWITINIYFFWYLYLPEKIKFSELKNFKKRGLAKIIASPMREMSSQYVLSSAPISKPEPNGLESPSKSSVTPSMGQPASMQAESGLR